MFYEDLKKLRPVEFKRYCGVKPKTFERMVAAVGDYQEKRRRKSGRPPKLSLADQRLLTLEYWREYRTFFHLGKLWGLHESSICRIVQRVETILTESRAFALPGKKRLQQADHTIEVVVVDASETPIERPKKTAALLQRPEEAPHTEKPSGNQ
jgi:hypothetical protein